MVLWWRESNDAEALLIDLLPFQRDDNRFKISLIESFSQKNDQISFQLRERGNEKFKSKNWLEAMEFYNQSLRYATMESVNISLAYANRSACFFNMGQYDKCLADIELAKKANYPQRLMPKLIEREANSINFKKKSTQTKAVAKPTLSFEADEMFPCMANVLQIRNNDEFGKHIVAKADIDVGKIILVEDAFVVDAGPVNRSSCKTCVHFAMNFIPCPNCSDVMFCDTKCMQSSDAHQIGCRAAYNRVPGVAIVESIIKAITAFSNIDELMTFVGKSLASRDFDSLEGASDTQKKYGLFLKLLGEPKPMDSSGVWKIFNLLLNTPEIKVRFDSIRKQRFLMHLILQHILIIERNMMAYGESEAKKIQILGNIASFFNHSCYHNTTMGFSGNQLIAFAVRPIRKGEQLFIRYNSEFGLASTEHRQAVLRDDFHFECKCSMCLPQYKEMDCRRMQMDPNYQYLMTSAPFFQDMLKSGDTSNLKAGLCEFLNKYGQLPWCHEINAARSAYDDILEADLDRVFNFNSNDR